MNELDHELIPEASEPAVSARPGIFFENLTVSLEEAALEQAASAPEEHSPGTVFIIIGGILMLLGLLVAAFFAGRTCDPTAAALKSDSFSLSNESFAVYFWDTCREAASSLQESGSSLPFDVTRDMDLQYYDIASGYTWQSYFMPQAAQKAAVTQALVHAAKTAGYILPESLQAQFAQQVSALTDLARAGGYADAQSYIHALYGPQVSLAAYEQYLFDQTLADAYAAAVYQNLSFTQEEIADHYAANLETYADLKLDTPNVDVRHILFLPAEDTTAANLAAKQNAEDAMAQCFSSGEIFTEDIFLQLVPEYSQDAGSSGSDGLLENLAPGTLGGSFDQWVFAPERKRGDMAVLASDYGWHLVYFMKQRDNYHWQEVIAEDLRYAAMQSYYAELLQKYPCRLTPLADVFPLQSS